MTLTVRRHRRFNTQLNTNTALAQKLGLREWKCPVSVLIVCFAAAFNIVEKISLIAFT